mmetsp:Transcript_2101/g.3196  ORF Transcript_2101/g.3196 Transcript_2101/m.3196 type:complete len:283 (+) Transcript_2101:59-907(+)
MVKLSVCTLASFVGAASAFAPMSTQWSSSKTQLSMSANEADSRRSFFTKAAGSAAVVAFGLVEAPEDAHALGSLKKVNAKLAQYGVATIAEVPSGFSPLAEVWGKGRNRDPLLVSFLHPIDWVVTLPSQDVNGEDGTIQAGEYARGDTATFFVYAEPGKVDIAEAPKDLFQTALIKSISQKGNNVYQNFKVTKLVPQKVNGQDYMICDFKYELLTGAGFEVDRIGVASVTSVGNNVEVLWTASTRQRYKKTETQLRTIADSFRCYSGGLEMSKIDYGSNTDF